MGIFKMKDRLIRYIKSLGFESISHKSSRRKIFFKDNIIVTVDDCKRIRK